MLKCGRAALICVLFSVPVLAAKFWESKEYTAWSEKDCMELLRKSPWAFSNAFGDLPPVGIQSRAEIPETTAGAQRAETQPTFGESQNTILFEFRALTALPVRMAIAQLQLIQRPTDAVAREQVTKMLATPVGKEIMLQISYRTIPPGSSTVHDIHSFFLHATIADFSNNTYLEGGARHNIPLVGYLAPNQARSNPSFLFPRFDDSGKPMFTGEEKSISLRSEFTPEIRGKKQKYSIFAKLNPKDMRFKNQFEF
jgi:hypothetical protein